MEQRRSTVRPHVHRERNYTHKLREVATAHRPTGQCLSSKLQRVLNYLNGNFSPVARGQVDQGKIQGPAGGDPAGPEELHGGAGEGNSGRQCRTHRGDARAAGSRSRSPHRQKLYSQGEVSLVLLLTYLYVDVVLFRT